MTDEEQTAVYEGKLNFVDGEWTPKPQPQVTPPLRHKDIWAEKEQAAVEPAPAPAPFRLPLVGGRVMDSSNNEFERRCLIALKNEQESINPDNSLIALFCDAVRCVREYSDRMQNRSAPAPAPVRDEPRYTVGQIAFYCSKMLFNTDDGEDSILGQLNDPQDGIKAVTDRNRKETK